MGICCRQRCRRNNCGTNQAVADRFEDIRRMRTRRHSFGVQQHTHEYLGSTKIAEAGSDPHNHRFAGVTGETICRPCGGHYHRISGNTDFYNDHFHVISDKTGPAIPVGNGKHVHEVKGRTSTNDGHSHGYVFATLIENPIGR